MPSTDAGIITVEVNATLVNELKAAREELVRAEEILSQYGEWRAAYPGHEIYNICAAALEYRRLALHTEGVKGIVGFKLLSDHVDVVWEWLEKGNVEGHNEAGIALVMLNAAG